MRATTDPKGQQKHRRCHKIQNNNNKQWHCPSQSRVKSIRSFNCKRTPAYQHCCSSHCSSQSPTNTSSRSPRYPTNSHPDVRHRCHLPPHLLCKPRRRHLLPVVTSQHRLLVSFDLCLHLKNLLQSAVAHNRTQVTTLKHLLAHLLCRRTMAVQLHRKT